MAVDVLKERGVPEDRILFLNLIASPEGIERFSAKFPKLHVITAFIDQVRALVKSPYRPASSTNNSYRASTIKSSLFSPTWNTQDLLTMPQLHRSGTGRLW